MAFIPPTTSHSDGSVDVPISWIITYMIIALIVWIAAATAAALYQSDEPNAENITDAVFVGAGLALIWPLSAAGTVIWLLVRHLTRPRPTTTPED
jgi:hypothetical protein